jgi:hypothetical protein
MPLRRRRRSSPLRAALWFAAALALAVAGWLRLPLLADHILLFVFLSWAAAAFLTLCAFLTVSVDDLGDVVWSAVRGSAPALWIAPAVLLLSSAEGAVEWIALALIAAAACLLAGQRAPRRLELDRAAIAPAQPMFQPPPLRRGTLLPVTFGALAFQSGLACAYAEYRLAAAAAIAFAVVIWTRSWISRSGAGQPRSRASAWRAVALALLLTLVASIAAFEEPPDPSEDLWQESRRVVARLTGPPPVRPAVPPPRDSPVPGQKGQQGQQGSGATSPAIPGVPGLILKPRPVQTMVRPPALSYATSGPMSLADPFTFPFTGEYQIFRSASGSVPAGAPVEFGSPLNALYQTTQGGALETQAYQPLIPPVDFARCGQVRIKLRSGEAFPVRATLQIFTGAGMEDLGAQLFRDAEETLPYFVPAAGKRPPVKAFRLVFENGLGAARSTRVEIVSFTLVPRPY